MTLLLAGREDVAAVLASGIGACDLGGVERSFGIAGCVRDGDTWSVARLGPWARGDSGGEVVAAAGVLLDHALGETIFVARPAGTWSLTTELAVEVLVPPPWGSPLLVARARMVHAESTGGYAEGELLAEDGSVLARATTWARYVPSTGAVDTTVYRPETAAAMSGAASLADHLGYRVGRTDGIVEAVLPGSERWNNRFGVLHGGVWAALVEVAATGALSDGSAGLVTTHMHVSYLRRAAPGTVVAQARPTHLGRTFAEVGVRGVDSAGRLCVSATITARRPG